MNKEADVTREAVDLVAKFMQRTAAEIGDNDRLHEEDRLQAYELARSLMDLYYAVVKACDVVAIRAIDRALDDAWLGVKTARDILRQYGE